MTEADFWETAARKGLPWFRWLRRPVRLSQLDEEFAGTKLETEWCQLKAQIQPGDEVWPFEFNVRKYLGMRSGYVVLRRGRPVGGIITTVS